MNIPDWLVKTVFQCDVTHEDCSYKELHIVWYDKSIKSQNKTVEYYKEFMLLKQGDSFRKIQKNIDGWSLSARFLPHVLEENIILFFTDFMRIDTIHDKGNFQKEVIDLKSWTEVVRRLTTPHYELARHHLLKAKSLDDFLDCSEYQLLQETVLAKFIKQIDVELRE